MSRKILSVLIQSAVLFFVLVSTSAASEQPAAIMVNGDLYICSKVNSSAYSSDKASFGYTHSVEGMPSKNGAVNFYPEGNLPYAQCENCVVIRNENEWIYCEPQQPSYNDFSQAVIEVEFASDELLKNPDASIRFIAEESEYQVKVTFSTNVKVHDFKVLSLNAPEVSEEGEMSFSRTEELFTLAELAPEKPLVVGMVFWGSIPNMGISYLDESGTERMYAISLSGNDGEPFLIESNFVK